MIIDRSETNEIRWVGTLSGEALREILINSIRDACGAPYNGLELKTLVGKRETADGLPDITFELVHDRDWLRHEMEAEFARNRAGQGE